MKNFKFNIHENNYNVHIISHEENIINLEVNGTKYEVKMKNEVKKNKTPTLVRSALKPAAPPAKMNVSTAKTKILCPIPGVILSINIKVGDTLNIGDTMLILEAMKMENNITAEKAGTVSAIHIAVGDQVLQSALMIELE